MDLALVAARLLLAAVFAVAGLAKLGDRAGSRQTLADFGVPSALAVPLGTALPLAELVVAVALIPATTAGLAAATALALLLIFSAGIGGSLARGRAPACRCFGQIASVPVSGSTIARNLVLASAAGLVAWQSQHEPGPSLLGWIGALTTGEQVIVAIGLIGLGLLVATVFLLFQIVGQQGRLLLRLDALEHGLAASGALVLPETEAGAMAGLPIGAPAPAFELPDLTGQDVSLDSLLAAERPVLLVFTDPHCGPCKALLPDVGRWQREHADRLTVAVVSRGPVEESRASAAEHGVAPVLLQSAYEVADTYQVYETPAAILVLADGTIGSALAAGGEQIRAQVGQILAEGRPSPWASLVPIEMVDNGHQHHGHQPRVSPSIARLGDADSPGVPSDAVASP